MKYSGALAAQAIAAGTLQKVFAFIVLKTIGGAGAPSPLGSPSVGFDMEKALDLKTARLRPFKWRPSCHRVLTMTQKQSF